MSYQDQPINLNPNAISNSNCSKQMGVNSCTWTLTTYHPVESPHLRFDRPLAIDHLFWGLLIPYLFPFQNQRLRSGDDGPTRFNRHVPNMVWAKVITLRRFFPCKIDCYVDVFMHLSPFSCSSPSMIITQPSSISQHISYYHPRTYLITHLALCLCSLFRSGWDVEPRSEED